jgi:5-methylcytosine-specific restriction endonuclease McrBC GTP-binding regulatory subunit McrB
LNPEIPYFICLDEMNLARVEYYFADFLSLLESRDEAPEINLYSADESAHVLSELKAVVEIIQDSKEKYGQDGVVNLLRC